MPLDTLSSLNDDVLLLIFSWLSVSAILAMRQTSKHFYAVSKERIVWQRACLYQVIHQNLPFPYPESIASLSQSRLEHLTRRALRFRKIWSQGTPEEPERHLTFQATQSNAVAEVRFLRGFEDRYVAVVSQGIWSSLTIWDIGEEAKGPVIKLVEWAPRGASLAGLVVNTDPESPAMLAISVTLPRSSSQIYILSIRHGEGSHEGNMRLETLHIIDSPWSVVLLRNNLIAFGDQSSSTVLLDWVANQSVTLESAFDASTPRQSNKCLQVIFHPASDAVIVVRAQAIDIFRTPTLLPSASSSPEPISDSDSDKGTANHVSRSIARHTFGWVDNISLSAPTSPSNPNFNVLVRNFHNDPWSPAMDNIYHIFLAISPSLSPSQPGPSSSFSSEQDPDEADALVDSLRSLSLSEGSNGLPHHTVYPSMFATTRNPRGHLRCPTVTLGPLGTYACIIPRPAGHRGLTAFDVHNQHTQTSPSLPGIGAGGLGREGLQLGKFGYNGGGSSGESVQGKCLWWNVNDEGEGFDQWTAMEYDEALGRVALGSAYGRLTILVI